MLEKIRKFKAKKNVKPIVGLTAYSYSVSKILDKFCDFTLVGDSLGNVLYGMKNTHKVTLDMIINHARSVKLGNKRSLLVVDMPKGTYKNPSSAKKNAIKIIKAAQCDAIKLESNKGNYKIIRQNWCALRSCTCVESSAQPRTIDIDMHICRSPHACAIIKTPQYR